MLTSPRVAKELRPGGRDYRTFELLQSKGLRIKQPSAESYKIIKKVIVELGEEHRVSSADCELLALAYEIHKQQIDRVIVLTDDYSIQNVASALKISFQPLSQQGITKKFKWHTCCPGCKKQLHHDKKICPVCGTQTISVVHQKKNSSR